MIKVSYKAVEFVWVSSHWDVHLAGLCRYGGRLCRFETDQDTLDDNLMVDIFSLSPVEKLRWLFRKKLFEWCVGTHWTYPLGRHYVTGGPLHRAATKLYYSLDVIRKR